MKIVISSGHGKHVSGAIGAINEVAEARKVVSAVSGYLKQVGISVIEFHDDTSKSQAENLNTITSFHNKQVRDLDVSVHFNAFKKTDALMGTEVFYRSDEKLAANVSMAISNAGGFKNRGAKMRTNLAFLNKTIKPSILIEVCFVDSTADVKLYQANFDKICRAIAEAVCGKKIPTVKNGDGAVETVNMIVNGVPEPVARILKGGRNFVELDTLKKLNLIDLGYDPLTKIVTIKNK